MKYTSRLRILMLKFPLESSFGGGELHTLTLAESLRTTGARVFLASSCTVLLREFSNRGFAARKTWGGIEPVKKTALLSFFFLWPFILANIWRLLVWYKRKFGINIIYCMTLTEKLLATIPARILGIEVVWIEHVSPRRWLTRNPYRPFYRYAARFVTVIAVSESLASELEEIGVPRFSIQVCTNGVDPGFFKRSGQALIKGVDLLQLKDKKIISVVARLHKEKGIRVLLEAFASLQKERGDLYLFVVGDGPEYTQLFSLAKHLGVGEQVFFFGHRDDIRPFLELSDVFVLPSLERESFGISIAEAMSMELPVVASKVGGIPELVEDGRTGILVEPGNSISLSKAVQSLLSDSARAGQMGKAGRERIKQNFSLAKETERIIDIFGSLVRERPLRVAFLKFPYESVFGGGELHSIQLATKLREQGADVFLFSSCNVLLKEFAKRSFWHVRMWGGKEVVSKGAILRFPFTAPLIKIRFFGALLVARYVLKVKVIYCLSLNEKLLATPIARLFGMKVVWIEHLLIERWLLQNPFRFLYLWMSRLARVVCVSDAVRHQLSNIGVREKNLRVIYNGVDPKEFDGIQPPESVGRISREEIENSTWYPVIGTASRLAKEKGISYLLEAMRVVVTKMPRALLVIMGDGTERKHLEKQAEELGISEHVVFLGFLPHDQVLGVISLLDIFTLTPISGESFGIALAEAMMLAKPVVATNIGGVSEVVSDNETGHIVRPKEPEEIAHALLRIAAYRDEALEMGNKGKLRVKEQFTLERMVKEFTDVFTA